MRRHFSEIQAVCFRWACSDQSRAWGTYLKEGCVFRLNTSYSRLSVQSVEQRIVDASQSFFLRTILSEMLRNSMLTN